VGLAQFLPVCLLFLPAGHLADRFDRRRIVVLSFAAWGASSVLLAASSLAEASAAWIYLAAAGLGSAQVINRPARDALLAQVGAFWSGLLAALIGPVPAVVLGGAATIAFVAGALRLFPELRRLGRLGR
jgi:MFS family permease